MTEEKLTLTQDWDKTFARSEKDAYENMIKDSKYTDNKQLLVIEGASHTDLYDGGKDKVIPFDKPEGFYKKYLS